MVQTHKLNSQLEIVTHKRGHIHLLGSRERLNQIQNDLPFRPGWSISAHEFTPHDWPYYSQCLPCSLFSRTVTSISN